MRFRTGVAAGAAIGFLLGIEVGHRRYDEVQAFLDKLGRREPIRSIAGAGFDFVDGTAEGAKDFLAEQMDAASEKIRTFASR